MLATIAVMFLMLSVAARVMILDSFEEHEREHTLENVDMAVHALSADIETLDMITWDWASWNDTHEFINDENQDYADSNFVAGTFEGMMLDMILITDLDGSVIYWGTLDSETGAELSYSAELLGAVLACDSVFEHPEFGGSSSGLLRTEFGALMFAARHVMDSGETLPPNGVLVMGRFLDNNLIDSISDALQLDVSYSLIHENGTADFGIANTGMAESGEPHFVQALSSDFIAGYALVEDIHGAPLLTIRVVLPRTIHAQGLGAYNLFQISLIAVMTVMGAVTLILLECSIVQRITYMNAQVNSIGTDPGRSARLDMKGKDEISSLATNINAMLDIREKAEAIQAELNRALESRLVELEQYKRTTVNREVRMTELKAEVAALKQKFVGVSPND